MHHQLSVLPFSVLQQPCCLYLHCSGVRARRFGAPQPAAPELEQFLSDAVAGGQVSVEQLQSLFPFQLDGFQERAVEQLLEGRSVVVCAPTGKAVTALASTDSTSCKLWCSCTCNSLYIRCHCPCSCWSLQSSRMFQRQWGCCWAAQA